VSCSRSCIGHVRRGSSGRFSGSQLIGKKVIELVGTSTESWEKAAAAAVERAAQSLRDLRIAEVIELDMHIENGKVQTYRAKVKVSFKFEEE